MALLLTSFFYGGILFSIGKVSIQDYSMDTFDWFLLILAQISFLLCSLSLTYSSLDKAYYTSYLALFSLLISGSVSDIINQRVKDQVGLIFSLLILGIFLFFQLPLLENIINGLISFFILYLIFLLSNQGLGGADVKVFFPIGMTLGILKAIESLILASYLALIYLLLAFLFKFRSTQSKISFFPFIFLGCLLSFHISIF